MRPVAPTDITLTSVSHYQKRVPGFRGARLRNHWPSGFKPLIGVPAQLTEAMYAAVEFGLEGHLRIVQFRQTLVGNRRNT